MAGRGDDNPGMKSDSAEKRVSASAASQRLPKPTTETQKCNTSTKATTNRSGAA